VSYGGQTPRGYEILLRSVSVLLEDAHRLAARSINTIIVNTTVHQFTEGLRKRTAFYDELWRDRIVLYNRPVAQLPSL